MREILFRGKSSINSKWVYGFLSYAEQEDKYYIGVMELMTPVLEKTVGQFTGLTDKNGVKIFEGDIVESDEFYPSKVNFKNGSFYFWDLQITEAFPEYWEIIGNIHDEKTTSN